MIEISKLYDQDKVSQRLAKFCQRNCSKNSTSTDFNFQIYLP